MPRLSPALLFPVAISAAAAIGLVKTLLLAALLEPASFGRYAVFMGVAVVATILISLGRIERTTKAWPRAWEEGDFAFLARDQASASRLLALRGSIVAMVMLALAGLGTVAGWLPETTATGLALAALLVVPGVILLLTASGMRAIGSMRLLLAFTTARSGLALLIAAPLAMLAGWEWALAGEALAQALVALWSWLTVRRRFAAPSHDAANAFEETAGAVREGRQLYSSNLIGSLVPFGGRGFIALIADAATAGAYAVAMVFVQIAQMFAGSVAQREGPLVIKLARRGETGLLRQLKVPAFLLTVLAAGSFAAFLISLQIPQAAEFWATYNLGVVAIGLTTIAMLAAFHMQLSFVLLAFDAERQVLRAAIVSTAVTYGGFLVASAMALGVPGFVASVAAGEGLRALYMLGAYLGLRRARDRKASQSH